MSSRLPMGVGTRISFPWLIFLINPAGCYCPNNRTMLQLMLLSKVSKLKTKGKKIHLCIINLTWVEPIVAMRHYPIGGKLLPKRWEATPQEVGSYSTRGAKLLHKRWEATTQVVGSYYPRGGKLLPKRWEATTQVVGSYYPRGGKLLPKWWGATTQVVGSYYPSGGELLHKSLEEE